MLTVNTLLIRSRPWLFAACVAAVLGTWLQYLIGDSMPQLSLALRVTMDLRREATVATWIESTLMLACGLSLAAIAWSDAAAKADVRAVWLLRLAALACVFFSADEAASLHELLGRNFEQATGLTEGTHAEDYGFSWILLYGPLAVLGCLATIMAYRAIAPSMRPGKSPRYPGRWLLYVALAGILALISQESLEWYTHAVGGDAGLTTCVEETLEILVLGAFLQHNMMFAAP